ncbi:MAG: YbhB/YbcL family Raf kinase inhibitor-like protein [Pseudomonadota bacterium]|nr:YbhB/YbcL family Raf kinase inhibitor-like protein [Pseudomonadota bacterium]
MNIWSDSFIDGGTIPPECAFGMIDPVKHMRFSQNRNPHLAWDDVPHGTESLVLLCHDPDVPAVETDVNQPGRTVALNAARVTFYHWSLVDIPVALKSLGEGCFSEGVTPQGKTGPLVPIMVKNGTEHQLRQGLNDFTGWFAGNPDMAGEYYGYDGPFPPWNDERVHSYLFTLYALDIPRFPLEGRFTGAEARLAINGHILDEARLFGNYALNPAMAAALQS